MLKRFYILLLFFAPISLLGQMVAYVPLVDEHPNMDSIMNVLKTKLQLDISHIDPEYPFRNKLKERYDERTKTVITSLEDNHYLFDPQVSAYLDNILDEILNTNPDIPKDEIRLFLARYPWPNATCIGEGTIVLNIGLLRRLENESQLAFVICHEIAHYTKDHSTEGLKKNVSVINGKKTKEEIKSISRQKYRAGQRARDFFKKITYDTRRHQREKETEADDIGLRYLKNTKYDATEAQKVLEILDTIDEEKYDYETNLTTVFSDENYPFKQKWIQKEDLLAFDGRENFGIEEDSLKTHPDCEKRIKLLSPGLVDYSEKLEKDVQALTYDELIKIADFEMIEGYFYFHNYGKTIYHALKLLNKYPDNSYLHAVIAKSFYKIHSLQSVHNLNGDLEYPNSEQEENYQEVLHFLHNLRLSEMAKVNYYFLNKVADQCLESEDFLFAWIMANDMMEDRKKALELKRLYREKFKSGYYSDELRSHFTRPKK